MGFDLGFDIGGTFTDLALVERDRGTISIFKVLTTPEQPERGALEGMEAFLASKGLQYEQVDNILHATTLVANTLIEEKGALVGLITTCGFRDILAMRTEQRYAIYDLFLRFPKPLSPRYLRRGVKERTDRDGRILEAIDPAEIQQVLADFRREGVEAIAVSFLHAYRNPENEQRVLEIIQSEWPEVSVSLSSVIAPEIREYERTSTTVANAYVQPLLARYLRTLEKELEAADFHGTFYPMLSSGSTAPLSIVAEQPIRLVESGPAAGAIAAAHYGGLAGRDDLISFDMGGTTAKICLIHDGQPSIAASLEVARVHRFKKGSGHPLQFPTVEMLEIGAGGGSIAWIDQLGLLKVGPESAGANPGPAAYGFGGTRPTVTDADLLLGYLNPNYFLGGEMDLDAEASEKTMAPLAENYDWDVVQAADGIHRVVNENMAAAAKIHIIEKARDPRKYALIAFGGAGPVHATGVAQILGAPEVIVAPSAGVASAIGLLIAPTAFDFVRSFPVRLADIDWQQIEEMFAEMEDDGRWLLAEVNIPGSQITVERSVEGRFEGQLHEIKIPLPSDLTSMDVAALEQRFHETYKRLYRHLPGDNDIQLLTWRVTVSGERPPIQIPWKEETAEPASTAQKGERPAYFNEAGGFISTPVYDRYRLRPGMQFEGPAIVEERESTMVIRPDMRAEVDGYLNLHIYL